MCPLVAQSPHDRGVDVDENLRPGLTEQHLAAVRLGEFRQIEEACAQRRGQGVLRQRDIRRQNGPQPPVVMDRAGEFDEIGTRLGLFQPSRHAREDLVFGGTQRADRLRGVLVGRLGHGRRGHGNTFLYWGRHRAALARKAGRLGAPRRVSSLEQREDVLRLLVRDRQRLDAELLLCLQRLQPGRCLFHVGIDERADAGLHRIGQLRDEIRLDAQPVLDRTEVGRRRRGLLDHAFDVDQLRRERRAVGHVDRRQQREVAGIGVLVLTGHRQRVGTGVGERERPRRGRIVIGHGQSRDPEPVDRVLEPEGDRLGLVDPRPQVVFGHGIGGGLATDVHRDRIACRKTRNRTVDHDGAGSGGGIEAEGGGVGTRCAERSGGTRTRREDAARGVAAGGEVHAAHPDVGGRDIARQVAVERRQDVGGALAAVDQVQAVELRRADHRGDLRLQRLHVGLDLVAVNVLVLRGNDLRLHLGQQIGHRLRRLAGHGHRRFTQRQAVGDALEPLDVRLHHLGDGPDRGIVLRAAHRLAGRDLALRLRQAGVDALERLQRNHGAGVRQNAGHIRSFTFHSALCAGFRCRPFWKRRSWRSDHAARLLRRRAIPSECEPILAKRC
ncbi:hypothetical protein SDC9_06484 [bioreactor metagenome]|uniref:Uncharacterized protein n=1 Tax=bioreactor metagenome TaxID=1076179 RepID=A0A644T1Y8_9ZZZZ